VSCPILIHISVSVERGQITVMGATLQAKDRHKFCTPSSHSLPVMRCLGTEANSAKFILHQNRSGLANLSSLSPLFGKLWNDDCGPLGGKQYAFLLSNFHLHIVHESSMAVSDLYVEDFSRARSK
jgi:polynucleotide 5'-hydroxyl-kinase GRC3/NOL9